MKLAFDLQTKGIEHLLKEILGELKNE